MKNLIKAHQQDVLLLMAIVVVGQLFFAILSPKSTDSSYEGRIYATTGVHHKQEDLHKLNEAAHYFGQTMIGWLKFPNFLSDLRTQVDLADGAAISAHIQERQNIIFSLSAPTPIEKDTLVAVKDFIQGKIDDYNAMTETEFVLTNVDYELVEIKRSYQFGAVVTLIATMVIGLALIFIRREFK